MPILGKSSSPVTEISSALETAVNRIQTSAHGSLKLQLLKMGLGSLSVAPILSRDKEVVPCKKLGQSEGDSNVNSNAPPHSSNGFWLNAKNGRMRQSRIDSFFMLEAVLVIALLK